MALFYLQLQNYVAIFNIFTKIEDQILEIKIV